jgi:hypothetical protein
MALAREAMLEGAALATTTEKAGFAVPGGDGVDVAQFGDNPGGEVAETARIFCL